MEEKVTERMVIRGTPQHCFQVLTDFELYPDWAADIKHVEVLRRDDEGHPVEVAWRAAAFGRSTSYTLEYDYGDWACSQVARSSTMERPAMVFVP